MARPGRFERPTSGSGDQRSIQLSYGRAVKVLPATATNYSKKLPTRQSSEHVQFYRCFGSSATLTINSDLLRANSSNVTDHQPSPLRSCYRIERHLTFRVVFDLPRQLLDFFRLFYHGQR